MVSEPTLGLPIATCASEDSLEMRGNFAPQVTLSSLDRREGHEEAEANSKTSVDSLGSRSVAHSL